MDGEEQGWDIGGGERITRPEEVNTPRSGASTPRSSGAPTTPRGGLTPRLESGESSDEETTSSPLGKPRTRTESGNLIVTETRKKTRGKQYIKLTVSAPKQPYHPNDKVELHLEVENNNQKEIKSIEVWLQQVTRRDGKKTKIEELGAHHSFYQGARFPLPPNMNYSGDIVFPIPANVLTTNFANRDDGPNYHIVVDLPYNSSTVSVKTNHIRAFLPVDMLRI
eukprot:TRINITY_DN8684_c0_g1_i1.p1 TRINITY_DN8684_c0_g1~~TRINITY_DN8684_c0_g1_i1.p1  ORF type:complete len:223 (+),score=56.39 TRINITY_DN8684_c0_g1_i1:77-745(+)